MKKPLLFLLVFFSVNCCLANDLETLGNQLSNFSLSPTKDNFSYFQQNADKFEKELKSSGNGADIMVAVMTARISEKYNWPIANTFFSKQAEEIIEGKSDLAQFINNDDLVNPAKLDLWWASYFATGDEKYLHKLLRFAGEEFPEGDTAKLMVIGAATWSFKSNCNQHKSIRDFAKKMSTDKNLSQKKRDFLIEAVNHADDKGT